MELAMSLFTYFTWDPLGVLGHFIARWKDMFKEITAPLES